MHGMADNTDTQTATHTAICDLLLGVVVAHLLDQNHTQLIHKIHTNQLLIKYPCSKILNPSCSQRVQESLDVR